MSWKYPRWDIRNNYVVGTESLNDNFHAFIDEASGSINEHNIDADSQLFQRGQLAEDAAFVLHYTKPAQVPSPVDYSLQTHWSRATIRRSEAWQTFDIDGLRLKFEATGGPVWLCASGQITAGTNTPSDFQKGFGYNIALMVDGVVVFDSLLGSADTTTDFYRGYQNRGGILLPSDGNDISIPQCGGGLAGALLPFSVDAVIDLAPGEHTIHLAVMNIKGRMKSDHTTGATYLTGYEMFGLEMLR